MFIELSFIIFSQVLNNEATSTDDKEEKVEEEDTALDTKNDPDDKNQEQDMDVANIGDDTVHSETNTLASDLCSDMQESLSILQQIKSNDPNVQKILEVGVPNL